MPKKANAVENRNFGTIRFFIERCCIFGYHGFNYIGSDEQVVVIAEVFNVALALERMV